MDNIIGDQWFHGENEILMNDSVKPLTDQIFDYAQRRMEREREDILKTIITSVPEVAAITKNLGTERPFKIIVRYQAPKVMDKEQDHFMNTKAQGFFNVVVLDSDDKTRGTVSLKCEDISASIDTGRILTVMQGAVFQRQMRDITSLIEHVRTKIEPLSERQYNYGYAEYISNEALYKEALSTRDDSFKDKLTIEVLSKLTSSTETLKLSLVSDIDGLCDVYDELRGRFDIKTDELKEKALVIYSSLLAVHMSSLLKTAIYFNKHEYNSALQVLSDYTSFLEKSISKKRTKVLCYAEDDLKNLVVMWDRHKNELMHWVNDTMERLMDSSLYELQ